MNQRHLCRMFGVAAVCLAAALPASALMLRCPPDSVKVGDACIDKYESSIWQIPSANTALVKAVQLGRVTLADLTNGGATQVSPASTLQPDVPADVRRDRELDEPAVRGLGRGREADELRDLVPGGAGVRALRKALAHEPGVAARGGRHARSRHGRRRDRLQRRRSRQTAGHRLAGQVHVELGSVRHGRQRRGMGGRLDSATDRSAPGGARSATTSCASRARAPRRPVRARWFAAGSSAASSSRPECSPWMSPTPPGLGGASASVAAARTSALRDRADTPAARD